MEKAKLEEPNPWWIGGKVDPELALPFRRPICREVEASLDKRFIIALVGLRRTGKTTAMYQLVQRLIENGTDPEDIVMFSFDESASGLGEVVDAYREFQEKDFRAKRAYVFLDEIQKCKNWENEVKRYYDLYPKMKFIVSGSESLFIRKKNRETLAGRIFEFVFEPFSFPEYLEINGVKEDKYKYEARIRPLFMGYVRRGGFPETFQMESDREFKAYVRSLVVDKIVYKDAPKLFRIEDPEFLAILLELISINPGMYVDYQSLSKQFGKDRRVIKDYLGYLRESFLVRILGNYRKSGAATLRKMKRAYPTDNAMPFLYKPQVDDNFFGKLVETAVINRLRASSFWKNGGEVDAVHDGAPIEVKYQERINSEDFRALREFMRKFKTRKGLMITKRDERTVKFEEGSVRLVPAWKWLLA